MFVLRAAHRRFYNSIDTRRGSQYYGWVAVAEYQTEAMTFATRGEALAERDRVRAIQHGHPAHVRSPLYVEEVKRRA